MKPTSRDRTTISVWLLRILLWLVIVGGVLLRCEAWSAVSFLGGRSPRAAAAAASWSFAAERTTKGLSVKKKRMTTTTTTTGFVVSYADRYCRRFSSSWSVSTTAGSHYPGFLKASASSSSSSSSSDRGSVAGGTAIASPSRRRRRRRLQGGRPPPEIVEVGHEVGRGSYGTVRLIRTVVGTTGVGSNDNEEEGRRHRWCIGKRAWTEEELRERFLPAGLTSQQIRDKASRCRSYFETEKHCAEKLRLAYLDDDVENDDDNDDDDNNDNEVEQQHQGLSAYLGSRADATTGLEWMLFDVISRSTTTMSSSSGATSGEGDDDDARRAAAEGEVGSNDGATEPPPRPSLSLQDLMEMDRLEHQQNNRHHLYLLSRELELDHSSEDTDEVEALGETLDRLWTLLLEVLQFIHSNGIVHRDVKPGNVLVARGRAVLIDFGSAADCSTAGWLKSNVGWSERVAISPVYAAPEVFADPSSGGAVNFDCFSAALLFCQLLFQYLDERTDAGFHQQLAARNWSLDRWLQSELQGKVRPAGLDQALEVLADRPGLWRLLQEMLNPDPVRRCSSERALIEWTSIAAGRGDADADGPFLKEVLSLMETCIVPVGLLPAAARPLQFVASFERSKSLGLILSEADASDDDDMDDDVARRRWQIIQKGASPGEVYVKGIVEGGQADEMGVFEIGDRLQGIGELPLAEGGFERAVEMLQDQPKSSEYVTLHFDRKPALSLVNNAGGGGGGNDLLSTEFPAVVPTSIQGPIQLTDQGAWSSQGRRKAQEDRFVLSEIHGTGKRSLVLAAVFDGHLGTAASEFCQREFPTAVTDMLFSETASASDGGKSDSGSISSSGGSLQGLLEEAWDQTCESYRSQCQSDESCIADYDPLEGVLAANTGSPEVSAGTTASIFALDKRTSLLTVLNCGDSRGVVLDSETGNIQFQTADHKPENDMDRLSAGQRRGLDYSLPQCRVSRWYLPVGDYEYAVSRSLEGRFATSKGIVSEADVHVLPLRTAGSIALVATDGLWEVMDSVEVARIAGRLRRQGTSAGDAAKTLCSMALQKGSMDNVSVIVLYLD